MRELERLLVEMEGGEVGGRGMVRASGGSV